MKKILLLFSVFLFLTSSCFAEGYNREEFGGWIDADGDGQDTREEVLIEESLIPLTYSLRKAWELFPIFGLFYCELTGQYETDPGLLDIDHRVPLKEAYESGAKNWPKEKKVAYANYLDNPNHLVAVMAGANRSKGSKDVALWLPIVNKTEYMEKWIEIKEEWNLCYDPAEEIVLSNHGFTVTNICSDE